MRLRQPLIYRSAERSEASSQSAEFMVVLEFIPSLGLVLRAMGYSFLFFQSVTRRTSMMACEGWD